MFLSPVDPQQCPGKRAWENFTLYDNGRFYAFFGTGKPSQSDPWGAPIAIDIAESSDGVRWRFIGRDLLPIPGAHAGFGVIRIGDRILYYPTCSNRERGVHMKVYSSRDFLHWEHMGERFDVVPDRRYYGDRWDEVYVLPVTERGRRVYYGYITAEVRDDIGAPSVGLMRSTDGVAWEVLPPPVIEWGELPSQHMELNFCEEIGGRYYLSMSGRFYLDSYGYSLYTFVGDSPLGPFRPDREMFRLAGTSRRSVTWLGHPIRTPEGLLVALWLSTDQPHDLPSDNFAIGPLKRLVCENGHLRLRYWERNELAKGAAIACNPGRLAWVHPAPRVRTERDTLTADHDTIAMGASRDGVIAMLEPMFNLRHGFIIEGRLTLSENRQDGASHHHPAAAGLFLESAPGHGCAILAETLGVTRTGALSYADHRITDDDIYAQSGPGLVQSRSGSLQGTSRFVSHDTVGPLGHASYCGVRHGRQHAFRLIARGRFFEFYVDDYYVQTWPVPETFTGRIGLAVFDGTCRWQRVRVWRLEV